MDTNGSHEELHQLAVQAKDGAPAALEGLLANPAIKGVIYHTAHEHVGHADADDIYQEVCVLIYRKLKTWQGQAKITNWIGKITYNVCMDFLRKEKNHWLIVTDDVPENPAEAEQSGIFAFQEMRRITTSALQDLKTECQRLMQLFLFDGLEKKELMDIWQLPKTTFHRRFNGCYETLSQKIQKIVQKSGPK